MPRRTDNRETPTGDRRLRWAVIVAALALLGCGSGATDPSLSVGGTYVLTDRFDTSADWTLRGTLVLAPVGDSLGGSFDVTYNMGTGDRHQSGPIGNSSLDGQTFRAVALTNQTDGWVVTGTLSGASATGALTFFDSGTEWPGTWSGSKAGN